MPTGGTGVPGAGAAIAAGPGAGIAVAAEPGAPTGCRPRSRAGGTVATGKVPLRLGWPGWGWRRLGWLAERHGWAGIQGHPPGRAAPGSRPAHGASASASAVRTRIRPARGGARAPRWPPAKGWRAAGGWQARSSPDRAALVRQELRPRRPGRGCRRDRQSRSWRFGDRQSRSWRYRGWQPTVAMRVGTIPREAPRRARNCRHRLTHPRLARRQLALGLACPGLACPGLGWAGQAPGNRRLAAGAGPESSGLAARTRGEPDFPDHPSGTALYAAAPPLARNHVDDSHSTGHSLYSSQTPVRAHFWQNAIACRS